MLLACKTLSPQQGMPAVLTHPTDCSRAELVAVIGKVLNGAQVTVAADALTRYSPLIIEAHSVARLERLASKRAMAARKVYTAAA